jgi:short-subunit dehydrogenase
MAKTVLITGSSSGIGKATATLFAQKGWNVVATMRTPQEEKELIKFPTILCLELDVTKPETINKVISQTITKFQKIDVLVNNAGFSLVGPFEASSAAQVEQEFSTNVYGIMNTTREILPHFREKKDGIIINVASMGGRITFPLYSLYHATKWAVEGYSESLQHELVPFNIKVKIIEPGTIKTDFYGRSMQIMEIEGITAYDDYVNQALPYMQAEGQKGSNPLVIAELIYKAATDKSWRLRYAAGKNARLALFLRRLLPDSIFNKAVRKMIFR